MRSDQVAEVLSQLGFGERVDLTGEVTTQTPDGAGVGGNGLGLKPLEFEVLQIARPDPIHLICIIQV